MAKAVVPAVEPLGIGAQQPLHAGDQVGVGGFDHQVKVIAHEAKAVHLPAGLLAALLQAAQELMAVLLIAKDGFLVVAPVHDVIDGPGILDAHLPCHRDGLT